jgi:hypothetical protein
MTWPHAVSRMLPTAYGTVYPSAGSLLPRFVLNRPQRRHYRSRTRAGDEQN